MHTLRPSRRVIQPVSPFNTNTILSVSTRHNSRQRVQRLRNLRSFWTRATVMVEVLEIERHVSFCSCRARSNEALQRTAHAFFLETAVESSKVISASPAVGGGAA